MKQFLKLIILFQLIFVCPVTLPAQSMQGEPFGDRLFYGGNFGLQFGNQTVVDINPLIGYKVTEKLAVGMSITYLYYSYKDPYNVAYNYTSNMYGGSLFTRYYLFESLFAHVEAEVLNMDVPDYFRQEYVRKNIFSFYVGGGYRQMMGANSSLNLMLLYNLNQDIYSPYQNPIIRIGFGFGI